VWLLNPSRNPSWGARHLEPLGALQVLPALHRVLQRQVALMMALMALMALGVFEHALLTTPKAQHRRPTTRSV
jgi:hypothetical protein